MKNKCSAEDHKCTEYFHPRGKKASGIREERVEIYTNEEWGTSRGTMYFVRLKLDAEYIIIGQCAPAIVVLYAISQICRGDRSFPSFVSEEVTPTLDRLREAHSLAILVEYTATVGPDSKSLNCVDFFNLKRLLIKSFPEMRVGGN